MKKVIVSVFIFSGIAFSSISSFATNNSDVLTGESSNLDKRPKGKENWDTFHYVVQTYKTSNGKFQQLDAVKQSEFFDAAESIKSHLAKSYRPGSEELSRQINITENVFRFVWNSKPEYVDVESYMDVTAPDLNKE